MLLQKSNDISCFPAGETFINLFGRTNTHAGATIRVERADTPIIDTSFAQRHRLADHINNIDGIEYFIYNFLFNHLLRIVLIVAHQKPL